MRYLLGSLLLITSCSSQKIHDFTKGCMHGVVITHGEMTGEPFLEEYIPSLYSYCEQIRNGQNN